MILFIQQIIFICGFYEEVNRIVKHVYSNIKFSRALL